MGDYLVGLWNRPCIPLAQAVAASAAFPPVLSPCILKLNSPPDVPGSDPALQTSAYRERVLLADGGVYDNLGLETAFKRYQRILVSDGGMKISPEGNPAIDWMLHFKRIFDLVDNQVRSLRKRQLMQAFEATGPEHRQGAYWSIRSHLEDYQTGDP